MDQTREERLQQRLRGAQRREIKEAEFDFHFAPPPPPPAAAPIPPVETNPEDSPAIGIVQQELPQAETPQQPLRRSPRRSTSHGRVAGAVDANTSAKRRRLEDQNEAPASVRSTRPSRAAPQPDVYDIPDDDIIQPELAGAEVTVELTEIDVVEAGANMSNPVTDIEPTVVDAENEENSPPNLAHSMQAEESSVNEKIDSPIQVTQKKRKREDVAHTVVPQENRRRKSARLSQGSVNTEVSVDIYKSQKRGRKLAIAVPATKEPTSRKGQGEVQEEPEAMDDEDVAKPRKRGRKPRRSTQKPEETTSDDRPEEEQEEAEAIGDEEAAIRLSNNRGRRSSRGALQIASSKDNLEPATKKQRGRPKQRLRESPVQQSHPKPQQPRTKASGPKKAHSGSREYIPVTVHHMSKPAIYDSEEEDADILNTEIPHSKAGGVNAIDVLGTFCQETISNALDTLKQGMENAEDRASWREYEVKYKGIEAFGQEIQSRLLQHTSYLDSIHSLQKRVREEQKKKLALREEILRVGREREAVALKMDQIRIQHEEEQETFDRKATLNEEFHSIELAMDVGKSVSSSDKPMSEREGKVGIELLIKSVAAEISSKSAEGGVLRRIKEFNAFLERAAGVLGS
ncbi:hypothetical protein BP5796_03193 [Coleophoma crateriformis]|uniref:Inner kinetochore subunit AME1 domain-containing protein n=1 Tax=Coleophoma crateriformis TaxID=565419 RepID=A0A3D8SMC4_9HELO|nr:hypothetical protein BP5796_03193 [Coleophoma crateriformis]